MTVPAKTNPPASTIEDVITKGDLSRLTPEQRTEFYVKVCNRHGLDPLTQPFDWLVLNGRLQLYANRRCADQLRKINGISINIVSQDYVDGLLSVHVKAKDRDGREDEDLGVVSLPDTLKGDARANTILKAITKGKRRVTLSISGLGYLDETEVDDIPAGAKQPPIDKETGEILDHKPAIPPPNPTAAALVDMASKADFTANADGAQPGLAPTEETMTGQAWRRFGEQMVKIRRDGGAFTPGQMAKMEEMWTARPAMYAKMVEALEKIADERRAIPQPVPQDDPDAYRVWLIDQMSRIETKKDLNDFMDIQRPLWVKCFPPDIEDWESLSKERIGELS